MNKEKLFEEFESLEDLDGTDFITIEQYGGGPDESSLKGTRNALNHFALAILKVTHDEGDDYQVSDYVDDDSVVGIDSIEVVEIVNGERDEYIPSFKDRIIQYFIVSLLLLFLICGVYGFFSLVGTFFKS